MSANPNPNFGRYIGSGKRSPIDVNSLMPSSTQPLQVAGGSPRGGILGRMAMAINDKLNGWFGPLEPIPVVAPENYDVRQVDYVPGYNRQIRPRGYEAITFVELRNLAQFCDLVRLAIETRKDQIAKLERKFQPKRLAGESGKDFKARASSDRRIAVLEKFFERPDGRHRFSEWMRMIVEDLLVVDAVTLYPRRTLGGGPFTVDVIDPATIAIRIDEDGRLPDYPGIAYQQIIKGIAAKDLTTRDLVYEIRNPRTGKFYGYSPTEQIVITINTAIRRALMQMAFYTEGNVPEGIGAVPDTWTPEQIQQFQAGFDAYLAGSVENRSKIIWGPSDKVVLTKTSALDEQAGWEWLARVVQYCFGHPPTPYVKQLNRSSAESQEQAAKDDGLMPIMRFTAQIVTGLIETVFGWGDLEMAWVLEDEPDREKQANIDKIYVAAGIRQIDEVRVDRGFDPLDLPLGFPTATGYALFPMNGVDPMAVNPGEEETLEDLAQGARVSKRRGLYKNERFWLHEARLRKLEGR